MFYENMHDLLFFVANAPSSVIDTNNSSALFAQSTDGADSGLQPISNYYVCIADYFAEQGHHEYALDFCQLALTYLPKHVVGFDIRCMRDNRLMYYLCRSNPRKRCLYTRASSVMRLL
jgi:hypothetical protein